MNNDYRLDYEEWSPDFGQITCKLSSAFGRIGYLNWSIENNAMQIDDLLIDNVCNRQQGLGSTMVRALIKLAEDKGIATVWGITQIDDHLVHDFYKKHGFFFSSEQKDGGIVFSQRLMAVQEEKPPTD